MSDQTRLERARVSLEGLAVGDAFGEQFFYVNPQSLVYRFEGREMPDGPWHFTDDTNMALSIYEVLRQYGEIDQDQLAASFAEHYHPHRGYGPAMHGLLARIGDGEPWQQAASSLFEGMGSYGNGSAMRVAPVGAYFADDLEATVEHARRAAEVTHAHPDAAAGAIAVAVGVAVAWQCREAGERPDRQEFIERVLPHVPDSEVRARLRHARDLAPGSSVRLAIAALGNGSRVTCQDTVPFVLWCAGEQLDNFEEALWLTARGLGDVDTTCAMVGGIVAAYTGAEAIPEEWIEKREVLPEWPFGEWPSP